MDYDFYSKFLYDFWMGLDNPTPLDGDYLRYKAQLLHDLVEPKHCKKCHDTKEVEHVVLRADSAGVTSEDVETVVTACSCGGAV